jgi:2-amino-4-hydroxy-6-hydroxymethyldihydropteridine diphosphokinase
MSDAPSMTSRAYIGLGSNLASPVRQLTYAFAALGALPKTRVAAVSSVYRTAPVGGTIRQPDYLNAVAALDTSLTTNELLRALQAIERRQRRRRTLPNAARSLDLDLLLHGTHHRSGRELNLPHPRLHRRAFVLRPLLEIAPDVTIPGRGRARRFRRRAGAQRITRIGHGNSGPPPPRLGSAAKPQAWG